MKAKQIVTTRRALMTGLASAGGLLLGGCSKQLPPSYGNVLRIGDLLTYTAHRLLLPKERLAKEYGHGDITSIPAVGTTNPADSHQEAFSAENGAAYERLQAGGFTEYRLSITR